MICVVESREATFTDTESGLVVTRSWENRREGEGEGVGQAPCSVTHEADVSVCCAQWGDYR